MGLIKKPSEIAAKSTISMMIYGQPGMGKTTLALSSKGAVLLDYDNGVNRINAAHQTDTLQPECWEQTFEAIREIAQDPQYQTIVVDTLGKMLVYIEDYIFRNDTKMNKGKRVWTQANGALTLKGYGERKNQFRLFLNQISQVGRSVVFVAHEKEERRDDKVVKRADVGNDSYASDIFKDLDLVGYLYGAGYERHLTFLSNDEHFCKKTGSMENDYTIPAVVDAKGAAIGENNFIEKVILATYMADQSRSKEMHKSFDELVAQITNRIAAIDTPEKANEFVEWLGSVSHIYNSLMVARMHFAAKVNELGFVYDKETKKYGSKTA